MAKRARPGLLVVFILASTGAGCGGSVGENAGRDAGGATAPSCSIPEAGRDLGLQRGSVLWRVELAGGVFGLDDHYGVATDACGNVYAGAQDCVDGDCSAWVALVNPGGGARWRADITVEHSSFARLEHLAIGPTGPLVAGSMSQDTFGVAWWAQLDFEGSLLHFESDIWAGGRTVATAGLQQRSTWIAVAAPGNSAMLRRYGTSYDLQLSSTIGPGEPRALAIDSQGDLIAAGHHGSVPGGMRTLAPWVAKISATHEPIWLRELKVEAGVLHRTHAMAVTPDDGVVIASGRLHEEPSMSESTAGSGVVTKLDESGGLRWTWTPDSEASAEGIMAAPDGNIVVAGTRVNAEGKRAIVLHVLNPDGGLTWTQEYGEAEGFSPAWPRSQLAATLTLNREIIVAYGDGTGPALGAPLQVVALAY